MSTIFELSMVYLRIDLHSSNTSHHFLRSLLISSNCSVYVEQARLSTNISAFFKHYSSELFENYSAAFLKNYCFAFSKISIALLQPSTFLEVLAGIPLVGQFSNA